MESNLTLLRREVKIIVKPQCISSIEDVELKDGPDRFHLEVMYSFRWLCLLQTFTRRYNFLCTAVSCLMKTTQMKSLAITV